MKREQRHFFRAALLSLILLLALAAPALSEAAEKSRAQAGRMRHG